MCNLGEEIYERAYNKAVAEIQTNQVIETEKLLKKIENEKKKKGIKKFKN